MILKKGVSLEGITPETKHAAEECDGIFKSSGIQMVITSGSEGHDGDGVHKKGSKHYTGEAFDIRIWNIPGTREATVDIFNIIQRVLGTDYDVILEKDHIHVEYDPKTTKLTATARKVKRVVTAEHTAVSLIKLIGGLVKAVIPFYDSIANLLRKFRK